jgi:hypothetical protein
MLRAYLEKRRISRSFESVIDPKTMLSVFNSDTASQPAGQTHIDFVLAFVRAETPPELSRHLDVVADIGIRQRAIVHDVIGAFVVLAFGTGPTVPSPPGNRASLVAALRERLASDIKIVHGGANGHVGFFGSGSSTAYTFLVPRFDAILGVLGRLEFGAVEEFRQ